MSRYGFVCLIVIAALLAIGGRDAGAQSTPRYVLRIATLAPRGTAVERAFREWNAELSARTNGELQARVYWGGSMGDERSMVRRMRIGDLEAANLTASGLGLIARPFVALQVPGVLLRYAEIDHVRVAMRDEIAAPFATEGYTLLGWGDSGRIRLFSNGRAIQRPTDLSSTRPWVRDDDSVFRTFLDVVGANGVVVGVPEVLAGLRTGMIDMLPATALVVVGLQWYTGLTHVTRQSAGFLIGGIVVRTPFLDSLPEGHRRAIFETADANQARVTRIVRRTDESAMEALVRRGMTAVDITRYATEWTRVSDETRTRLAGRSVPAEFLTRVQTVVAQAPAGE